ncbi:MAG: prepilin-type N-terminal cleavage/methylation domain-containing protein [Armatimonas sp.]
MQKKIKAFTLVEMMIVVLIIGMLVSLAAPNFVRARETARAKSCAQNLRVIEVAKDQYMMDYNLPRSVSISESNIIGPSSYIKENPQCPSNGTYTIGKGNEEAICNFGGAHNLRGY